VSATPVSVIVPVFNSARFLAEALASIVAQDYRPLDVLLIDDGSTDASAHLAGRLARGRPEVRLLRQPVRRGPAAARNVGLREARGQLITFLDADDLMTPGRLRFQADYLAAYRDVDLIVGTQTIRLDPGVDRPEWLGWTATARPPYYQMSMMARRTVFDRVGAFDESFQLSSDTEWMYRANAAQVSTALVDRVLLVRRIHGANLTYATAEMRQSMRRALLVLARARVRRAGTGP